MKTSLLASILSITLLCLCLGATNSQAEDVKRYSFAQMCSLSKSLGFKGDSIAYSSAVAMTVSGGEPRAIEPKIQDVPDKYRGRGLYQIRLTSNVQNYLKNRFGIRKEVDQREALLGPKVNTAVAFYIYKKTDNTFRKWVTPSVSVLAQARKKCAAIVTPPPTS